MNHKFEEAEAPDWLFSDKEIEVSEDTFKSMFIQGSIARLIEKLYEQGLITMKDIETAANQPIGDCVEIQFGSTRFRVSKTN